MKNSKSIIKGHSADNVVIQNSNIENNNIILNTGSNDLIGMLSKTGNYNLLQKYASETWKAFGQAHPLFPEYSAKFSDSLHKLVSSPETKDALEKYPKIIKGKFSLDYKKYPYMDKEETIWEYAYRTQTKVELETTEYKEFLGDIEDPFPTLTYQQGMKTIIGAPKFPDPVDGMVIAGNKCIQMKFKRFPCMEYGKIIIGSADDKCGFNICIEHYEETTNTVVSITKNYNADMLVQLEREQLFCSVLENKNIKIVLDNVVLMDYDMQENDLNNDIFEAAPVLEGYIKCLLEIEKKTGCKFISNFNNFNMDEYNIAMIISASLNEKWRQFSMEFDNEIRCDYSAISDEILEIESENELGEISVISNRNMTSIVLQGVKFKAQKYVAMYRDAKINNIESVKKNMSRKKKDIMVTIKPINGKRRFKKYVKFEGVSLAK